GNADRASAASAYADRVASAFGSAAVVGTPMAGARAVDQRASQPAITNAFVSNVLSNAPDFDPDEIVIFDGTQVRADLQARPVTTPSDECLTGCVPIAYHPSSATNLTPQFASEKVVLGKISGVEATFAADSKSVQLNRGSVLFAPDR